jgi:glyoxylase-like metal-dependent hydrolase (beta-lactamase superfamily II)
MTEKQPSTSRGRSLSFREIVNGVFLIDTLAAGTAGLVAGYLVKGEQSALIDVGYPTSAKAVLFQLRELDSKHRNVDYLIPTHVHLDHAGAVGHLARAMPNARVLASAHGAKHMIDPSRLIESATKAFGREAMSVLGTPISVAEDRIEPVEDEFNLDLGAGKRLRIFRTPGRTIYPYF